MSQDDFPSDDFPSVYFPIVQFSKRHTFPNVRLDLARRRRLQQGPSTEARTGWGCQARRLRHIWEVSVWENTHRKFFHGKRPLGKYLSQSDYYYMQGAGQAVAQLDLTYGIDYPPLVVNCSTFYAKELSFCNKLNCLNLYISAVCNEMVKTFYISNLDYLIKQNSQFEISKVYYIGLQRNRDQKIIVCCKNSIPFNP